MTRDRRPLPTFCAVVALVFPLGALAQEIRLGVEFQVNTHTSSRQRFPSMAAEANGDFVVVWESYGQDGQFEGVFGARFSSAGARLATEFQVNTYTTSNQVVPRVAVDADGDFVVAWQSNTQDSEQDGVFARRFSSAGNPLASELQVNTFTPSYQRNPSVAADADGDFVVAWQSNTQDDGSTFGIFARRFSSAGNPLASEFQVNTYTPVHQRNPAVAADSDGDFVVAWQDRYHDGSGNEGVFARRFSSAGVALASEFQVNDYTIGAQSNPTVAASASGDFVAAWVSGYQDAAAGGIFARRFSSAGTRLANEFQVNTATIGNQIGPAVAADSDGDFVAAWSRDSNYVLARRFSSSGASLAVEFQVHIVTGNQDHPALAVDADSDFVVAWQDSGRDGSDLGVFAQRFSGPITLDIDGNGVAQALTDGLLVVRRFFGFTGATLTTGAVGAGCTRCDAAAIEPYIAGLGLVLDVDGNTSTDALTDGLLALRYLFGFTGVTLTGGAVGGSCSRCDASTIEPYLLGLV